MTEPKKERTQVQSRDYVAADFETLWQLDQICFTRGIAYSKQELAHYIKQPNSFTIIIESDKQVCGFIVVERDSKGTGRIITIDVSPESRRGGLGSALMNIAEDRLRVMKTPRVVLEVAVDNLAAVSFYKRRGYSVVGTLRRYYLNSLDALRMEKTL